MCKNENKEEEEKKRIDSARVSIMQMNLVYNHIGDRIWAGQKSNRQPELATHPISIGVPNVQQAWNRQGHCMQARNATVECVGKSFVLWRHWHTDFRLFFFFTSMDSISSSVYVDIEATVAGHCLQLENHSQNQQYKNLFSGKLLSHSLNRNWTTSFHASLLVTLWLDCEIHFRNLYRTKYSKLT